MTATPPETVLMSADLVGGVWSYALELARALAPAGTHVVVAAMGGSATDDQRRDAEAAGVTLFTAPFKLEWMDDPWPDVARAGEWLSELAACLQPDVVHLNHYAHGGLDWDAPVVMVGHSDVCSWFRAVRGHEPPPSWERYRRVVAAGLRAAGCVIAPTDALLDSLAADYGPLPRARVIHNGRDAARFRVADEKAPVVLAAGRLWDDAKNLAALEAVAPRVRWPIVVAGPTQHPDGGARTPVAVHALGRCDADEMATLYARSAIYALPARYEPFGLSILEAALSGCALVLGDIPSLRELWDGAAEFVAPDDVDALAAAIDRLSDDPARRRLFGAAHGARLPRGLPRGHDGARGGRMRVALFVHSLLSDWNHGNAHFLRGLVTELVARGHAVRVFEPRDAWSAVNLAADAGEAALERTRAVYPALDIVRYDLGALDLDAALVEWGAELVLVHEWNDHALVAGLGRHRAARGGYALVFHDTHHRSVSDPAAMAAYDLSRYDGVIAFGTIIRDLYLTNRWARRAWVLHEAADVRVFAPRATRHRDGELVWIGNWGDEERTRELEEMLFAPVRALGLHATVHGVRYPAEALRALAASRIRHCGWLANYEVPDAFARHRVTVHVPRRQYATLLPGIPTIRPFEAMACGIPLVSAPWIDSDGLFSAGEDYLVARDGRQMRRHLRALLADEEYAATLAAHAHRTILSRHTCAHRADELCAIARELGVAVDAPLGAGAHA